MSFDERVGEGPTRLLLVEDYAPLAEATAELLRDAGLTVRIAESGKEALRVAIAFRPDIVLFDLSLPDMSGLDVARALRSNPDTKDALLAMHTAMSDIDIRTFRSEIPLDEVNLFLPKPLTDEKVATLLAGLAALRRPAGPAQD
jgi:two-component system CheB/CheR fusion protein